MQCSTEKREGPILKIKTSPPLHRPVPLSWFANNAVPLGVGLYPLAKRDPLELHGLHLWYVCHGLNVR